MEAVKSEIKNDKGKFNKSTFYVDNEPSSEELMKGQLYRSMTSFKLTRGGL